MPNRQPFEFALLACFSTGFAGLYGLLSAVQKVWTVTGQDDAGDQPTRM